MAFGVAHWLGQCLYLDRNAFFVLFTEERLNVQFAKRNAVSAEAFASGARGSQRPSVVAPVNAVKDKTAAQRTLIFNAVKGNLLFEGLTDGDDWCFTYSYVELLLYRAQESYYRPNVAHRG